MASDINSVCLTGNLTRDMELSYTQGGLAVGKFSIAVNRSVKQGDQWVDEASFFECTLFGKVAESLKQYLIKGKQVAVQGTLKQDRWEKDGQKHSKVSIIVLNLKLLGGKSDATGGEQKSQFRKEYEQQQELGAVGDDFPEDIPF